MPSIDYDAGIGFINSFMVDTCVITRDIQQVNDDTLDVNTGLLVRPVDDTTLIYSGICLFKRPGKTPDAEIGDVPVDQTIYKLLVPNTVEDVRFRDIVRCSASPHDGFLPERIFRVMDVGGSTHLIYRAVFMRDITDAPFGE